MRWTLVVLLAAGSAAAETGGWVEGLCAGSSIFATDRAADGLAKVAGVAHEPGPGAPVVRVDAAGFSGLGPALPVTATDAELRAWLGADGPVEVAIQAGVPGAQVARLLDALARSGRAQVALAFDGGREPYGSPAPTRTQAVRDRLAAVKGPAERQALVLQLGEEVGACDAAVAALGALSDPSIPPASRCTQLQAGLRKALPACPPAYGVALGATWRGMMPTAIASTVVVQLDPAAGVAVDAKRAWGEQAGAVIQARRVRVAGP
ncbi:MAG: hypothetical protein H6706_03875 [Myxococcales bacterium]|nr:hypothetical protein [Myxococcales bacterium]